MADIPSDDGNGGSLYDEASYMSGLVPTDVTGTGNIISPSTPPIFTLSPTTQSLATLVNSTFGPTSTTAQASPVSPLSNPLIWLIGGGILLIAVLASTGD
jgi:hypothetical protein